MMQIPKDYATWVPVLDALKNHTDDEAVLQAMQQGTLVWQGGVAERFSKRLLAAVNGRLDHATDTFQKQMARARGQEGAIIQALLQLRKELAFMHKALAIPAVPEEQRKEFQKLVTDQADKMQQSLMDSAKQDRSGKLASIVRNHPLNR